MKSVGILYESHDLADGRETLVYSQTPSRKIESTVIVVAARVATATSAHHANTGICFSSSWSLTLRMPLTSASMRV